MNSMSDKTAMNTDREIWRLRPGDYYSPSIHVTEGGGIGMNIGGFVIVKPVEWWYGLAKAAVTQAAPVSPRQEWISVEDRLPADGEPVMFGWWNTSRGGVVAHYCAELGMHRAEDGYWESERTAPQDEPIRFEDTSGQVTHWMPLPNPPASVTLTPSSKEKI